METNQNMPSTSINYIKEKIKLTKKTKILILGLSYREGVGDYRSSPSLVLYKKLKKYGAVIHANDPLVDINSINELKKNIIKFREDELHHKDIAYEEGATKEGPYSIMDKIIKTGSKIAINISEKI